MQRQPLLAHDAELRQMSPSTNAVGDRERDPDQRHDTAESREAGEKQRAHMRERTIRLSQNVSKSFSHTAQVTMTMNSMWRTT